MHIHLTYHVVEIMLNVYTSMEIYPSFCPLSLATSISYLEHVLYKISSRQAYFKHATKNNMFMLNKYQRH